MRQAFWRWNLVVGLSILTASGAVISNADQEHWEKEGCALFMKADFKQAAQAFQKGLRRSPDNAALHCWVGKSYARLADISTFAAAKNARRARAQLEQAVRLDAHNEEYARELFDLYVEFPEFCDRGLGRASALIESFGSDDDRQAMVSRLQTSQRTDVGIELRLRTAASWTVSGLGYLVPFL
jgi:tetratricopeptide (TPR) repeat protein